MLRVVLRPSVLIMYCKVLYNKQIRSRLPTKLIEHYQIKKSSISKQATAQIHGYAMQLLTKAPQKVWYSSI